VVVKTKCAGVTTNDVQFLDRSLSLAYKAPLLVKPKATTYNSLALAYNWAREPTSASSITVFTSGVKEGRTVIGVVCTDSPVATSITDVRSPLHKLTRNLEKSTS
jgi:hypothetical protein